MFCQVAGWPGRWLGILGVVLSPDFNILMSALDSGCMWVFGSDNSLHLDGSSSPFPVLVRGVCVNCVAVFWLICPAACHLPHL